MKHVSFELDTEKGEGITHKLKFAAKQLNDRNSCILQGYQTGLESYPPLLTMIKH